MSARYKREGWDKPVNVCSRRTLEECGDGAGRLGQTLIHRETRDVAAPGGIDHPGHALIMLRDGCAEMRGWHAHEPLKPKEVADWAARMERERECVGPFPLPG